MSWSARETNLLLSLLCMLFRASPCEQRLRGHLLSRPGGSAHTLLRSHGLPAMVRSTFAIGAGPPVLSAAAAAAPGHPRFASELLLAGGQPNEVQDCFRNLCKGTLVMDDLASAQAFCTAQAARGINPPGILCLKEMEFIGVSNTYINNARSLMSHRAHVACFCVCGFVRAAGMMRPIVLPRWMSCDARPARSPSNAPTRAC